MLLAELDAERPEAVREVLTYPYVQAWAMQMPAPGPSADFELDRAHLAGLAAAAALRAGVEVELILPVREGLIYLPAVGALAMDAGAGRTSAVHVSPIRAQFRHRCAWLAYPFAGSPPGICRSRVEDIDPFRDCQAWAAAGRLLARRVARVAAGPGRRDPAARRRTPGLRRRHRRGPAFGSADAARAGGPAAERYRPAGVRRAGAGAPRGRRHAE